MREAKQKMQSLLCRIEQLVLKQMMATQGLEQSIQGEIEHQFNQDVLPELQQLGKQVMLLNNAYRPLRQLAEPIKEFDLTSQSYDSCVNEQYQIKIEQQMVETTICSEKHVDGSTGYVLTNKLYHQFHFFFVLLSHQIGYSNKKIYIVDIIITGRHRFEFFTVGDRKQGMVPLPRILLVIFCEKICIIQIKPYGFEFGQRSQQEAGEIKENEYLNLIEKYTINNTKNNNGQDVRHQGHTNENTAGPNYIVETTRNNNNLLSPHTSSSIYCANSPKASRIEEGFEANDNSQVKMFFVQSFLFIFKRKDSFHYTNNGKEDNDTSLNIICHSFPNDVNRPKIMKPSKRRKTSSTSIATLLMTETVLNKNVTRYIGMQQNCE
ncbi:hypothetical protein RFI_09497 [Reticulomyxa filosa]|uniref:Uncharacterized protein n=1 Tax=Reticulomyxa filosa TaxID=46433 RepID=X6NQJ5_RETFI|nr:hypothetical protein RFI_09497 [Reticulomyxa filosa]|eukprot:ETO27637.1 hypothetical protein RFI_09497 [Reticulomyxa filosa]